MGLSEDFNSFFRDFGVDAQFGQGETISMVRGIFDTPYTEIEYPSDTAGSASRSAYFTCAEADITQYGKNTLVVIKETQYRTKHTEPDGTGLVRVPLVKIS